MLFALLDGVFASAAAGGVVFHAGTGLDGQAIAAVQAKVRRRDSCAASCAAVCSRAMTRAT